jgi:hypothetical protein
MVYIKYGAFHRIKEAYIIQIEQFSNKSKIFVC